MKAGRSMICFIVALHSALAVPLVCCQENTSSIDSSSNSKSNVSFSSLSLRRIKREDDVDTFPTRHAKHRRKRRCKNRPACSRLISSQQKFFETQQSNDYDVDIYNEKFIVDGYTETKENTEARDDYVDNIDLSSVSIPMGDLSTLLTRLFQTLRNTSIEDSQEILKGLNFVSETVDVDPCQKWLNSKDKLEEAFLGPLVALPACPCQYPSNIFYDDKVWDEKQQKHFRWRDVSGESQRLDVYKPGAAYCVRSLLAQGSGSAAAQHCCYDRQRRLLTRGSGAGTPNFVSPEISIALHEKIDILPWRLCKGDFSRFNKVRPPDNGNGCDDNPDNEEYLRQINNTKYY